MNTVIPPASEGPLTLYHRRHAKQQRGKTAGHLGAAVVLVLGVVLGVAPILSGAESLTLLVGVEVLVGAAYLVLMVRELLHLRHHPFHRERVGLAVVGRRQHLGPGKLP